MATYIQSYINIYTIFVAGSLYGANCVTEHCLFVYY